MTQRALAKAVGVPYQTINAIISYRRNITLEIALNIEKTLTYEEGFLLILQDFNNISVYKEQKSKEKHSHALNIRKSLFWYSDFNRIDWENKKICYLQSLGQRQSKRKRRNCPFL